MGFKTALGVVTESRFSDLYSKGVLTLGSATYDPSGTFDRVVVFTPYAEDLVLSEEMERKNIHLIYHGGRARKPWLWFSAVMRMVRAIHTHNIKVMRGSNPFLGSLMGTFAAKIAGIPSVVWLGGDNRIAQAALNKWYYRSRKLTNMIEFLTLHMNDVILVPNQFTFAYVLRIAGESLRPKIKRISWSTGRVPKHDPEEPDLSELGISLNDVIVPIIGFINQYKFSHILFDALEEGPLCNQDGKPAQFIFCGDGNLRTEGERRFADRTDVCFIGFQQKPIVEALIRHAHIVCIPMSGNVVLEAASVGKPVISSNIEWHSEIIKDGETGLLVAPLDPVAWRNAVTRLLADPCQSSFLAENLHTQYEKNYSAEIVAKQLDEFYSSLIN